MNKLLSGGAWVALGAVSAIAVEIDSIGQNGSLSFWGAKVGTTASVEWAASLTEAGRTNWHSFTNLVVTDNTMQTDIPMFYRVKGTPDTNLLNGLVAWYPFNGNANDMSGYGNNGTVYGATLTTDRFGNPNSAYHFALNVDYQYINCGVSSALDLTNDFAISLRYNADTWTNGYLAGLVSRANTTNGDRWQVWYAGIPDLGFRLTTQFTGFTNAPGIYSPEGNAPTGTWEMLTISRTAGDIDMYINGQLQAATNKWFGTFPSFAGNLFIGALGDNYANRNLHFCGNIDDVRIYRRSLKSNEVWALYNLPQ